MTGRDLYIEQREERWGASVTVNRAWGDRLHKIEVWKGDPNHPFESHRKASLICQSSGSNGFSPDLARKVAEALRQAADVAERFDHEQDEGL